MKNFTNNFKQFTSRLSARWLIMGLMLLVGTSSVWADPDWACSGTSTWNGLSNSSYYVDSGCSFMSGNTSIDNKDFGTLGNTFGIDFIVLINDNSKTYYGGTLNYKVDNASSFTQVKLTKDGDYGGNGKYKYYLDIVGLKLSGGKHTITFYLTVPKYTNSSSSASDWYISNGGNNYKFTFTIPTPTYTISYNANGGSGAPSSQTKNHDKPLTLSTTKPTRTGYTFQNWNTKADGTGTSYASGASYTANAAATLYAQWTANQYDITYKDKGNVTFTGIHATGYPTTHTYGTPTTLKDPTKSGYNFLGWFTNSACTGDAVTSLGATDYTSDITLYANWELACDPPAAPDFGSESSAEYCDGDAVSFPTINGVTLKWYDEETGGNVVESPETNVGSTNYYAAAVEECESTERTQYTITIKTKPTVSLNPNENTVCTNVTLGDITDYVEIESTNGSQISWYAAAQGGDALATSTPLMETSYFAEATLNGCSSDREEFTITDVLSAPTEVPNVTAPETICDGESAVLELNNKDANYTYSVNGEEVDFTNNEYTVYPTITTDYTVSVENKCGSLSTTKTITVNPRPTITSISASNDEPVPFEDVVLTATDVTQGAEVKWYLGNDDTPVATGTTYVVTSENAGDVTVKAKAFLNGCESTAASYTVAFSAEKCSTGKTKIRFRKTYNNNEYYGFNTGSVYLYSWDSETGATHTGSYPGTLLSKTETINSITYYIHEFTNAQSTENLTILFRAQYDYGGTLGKTYDIPLSTPGATYQIELKNGDKKKETDDKDSDNSNSIDYFEVNSTPSGGGIIISTPAVKTVSVTSDEDGNVTMVGQVVKTGCDTQAILGLQYKKQKQDGTYDDNYTTYPNPGTKEAISAGKTFTVTTKLEDGTYKVRARIDNSHATNGYGEDIIVVVNTVKIPITSVTLTHVKNQAGDPYSDPELANLIYCAGDEVWFELNYEGSKFIPENNVGYKWTTCPGNGLIGPYNGNKYKFTITSSGTIGISLRNEENVDGEGNPTWVESKLLEFKTHPEPTAPYISINPASGVLCEGYTATITVTNPSTDCAYKLVEEGSKAGFTDYESGDLTYTVGSVGKYYVAAQHIACRANEYTSNQVEINQIIRTNATISIDPDDTETTPWEPVTITVNPEEGYVYELSYTDNNLAGVAGVIIKQNGDSYTYYIPRPNSWGTGNGARDAIQYGIKATLKVEGEATQCQMSETTATITLKDEENEDCD